jgi:hypothetical protein
MKAVDARGWVALSTTPTTLIFVKKLLGAANGDPKILERREVQTPQLPDSAVADAREPYLSMVATLEFNCAAAWRQLQEVAYYSGRNLSGQEQTGTADGARRPTDADRRFEVERTFACAKR